MVERTVKQQIEPLWIEDRASEPWIDGTDGGKRPLDTPSALEVLNIEVQLHDEILCMLCFDQSLINRLYPVELQFETMDLKLISIHR